MAMDNVYIAAATRTAVGKAPRGTLRDYRPDDMAAAVLTEVVRRAGNLAVLHGSGFLPVDTKVGLRAYRRKDGPRHSEVKLYRLGFARRFARSGTATTGQPEDLTGR